MQLETHLQQQIVMVAVDVCSFTINDLFCDKSQTNSIPLGLISTNKWLDITAWIIVKKCLQVAQILSYE